MFEEKNFEGFPSNKDGEPSEEQLAKANEWEQAMNDEAETTSDESANASSISGENEVDNDYASVNRLNKLFKLDAISEYYGDNGIEKVMNDILTFDAKDATAGNVATKFYMHMGIDSPAEYEKICEMDAGMKENAIGAEKNNEQTKITSMEGLMQDFQTTKELIEEIKAADPAAAEDLESGSSGGYFRRIERSAMKRYGFGGVTGVIKYLSGKKEAMTAGRVEEFEAEDEAELEGDEPVENLEKSA